MACCRISRSQPTTQRCSNLLFRLGRHHPQYKGDPKLSFYRVMCCAVLFNRVEMLECINELLAIDSAR